MAKPEPKTPTTPRRTGRKILAGATHQWADGEQIVGRVVSAKESKTRHGVRTLFTIEMENDGEHRSYWMPEAWAARMPAAGTAVGVTRDGNGIQARYEVVVL